MSSSKLGDTKNKIKPKSDTAGDSDSGPEDSRTTVMKGSKIMMGAAAAGVVAGTVLVGPMLGIAAGIGSAASTLRNDKVCQLNVAYL
jgi:hypothetical protein